MSENADIYRISTSDNREIVLVGTAHISQASKELVKETIEAEKPDTVCVELDAGRMQSLKDPDRWKNTDLKSVIKNKQLATLHPGDIAFHRNRVRHGLGVQPLVTDSALDGGNGHGVFQKEQVIGENVGRDAVRIGLELRGQLLDLSARLGKGRPIAD